ncbi:hypothetical protein [Halobacillus salinus]|uniref:GNAT family N-acetyltransferase n=1 Tax=Halobacillus salinus TaxID=192814 RepID=A0A4Z0GWD6_9BACI|nr:hypothetical protein [Halobacillus salinus]TGB01610.1 hypothetical protein E4663_15755 [Halobacillus salinus]
MYIEKVEDHLYQLKKGKEKIGDFHLVPVEDEGRKIEKLQVSEEINAGGVLAIFELIQAYAWKEDIPALYVESHSDSLDFLLQHQQFKLEDVEKRLWKYQVNHT